MSHFFIEIIPIFTQGLHLSTMCDRNTRKIVKIGTELIKFRTDFVKIGTELVRIGTELVKVGTELAKLVKIETIRNEFSENTEFGTKYR